MRPYAVFLRRWPKTMGLGTAVALSWLAALTAPVQTLAVEVAEELFADDYAELDPTLGEASDVLGVKDNTLFRKQAAGYYWRSFYDALLFDDADAKIRVRLADWGGETDGIIGLAFWGSSLDDFYVVQISDSGTYSVARATSTSWSRPVSWRSTDALNLEPGAWNEIRVVTSGARATIFVNGKELISIKGRPPTKGSLFGLFCQAAKADLLCEFSDLRISQGPAPSEDDVANDPTVLLADEFVTLDPAWGSEQGWFRVKDKHLAISFEPHQSYKTFYDGAAFGDVDATVNVRTVADRTDGNPASGIIFWGEDYEEFYLLQVFAEGSVCVARRINGDWRYPLRPRQIPADAKFDPQGWTKLRLTVAGKKATVYVNGVKLATVPGQPPHGDWKLGVYGQAGDVASESQFSELVVRKP